MVRSSSLFAMLAAFAALAGTVPAGAGAPVKEVPVVGPRVLLADVVPAAPASVASVDLGPAPAPGGSRFVTQDELKKAAAGAGAKVLAALPAAVRVVRKMKHLTAADIDRETRKAVATAGLRKGVTLQGVRAPKSADVAEGWTSVTAEVPKPPRRTGKLPTTATLTFSRGTEVLARLAVPIDLDLSAQAAIPDIAKGGALTITVRAGLVEISAAAMASADADIGDELMVTLRPSGRILRAVLVGPDRALLVAASQSASSDAPAPSAPSPALAVVQPPVATVTVVSSVPAPPMMAAPAGTVAAAAAVSP